MPYIDCVAINGYAQMDRSAGSYVTTTTLGELVQAFVPHPLPPTEPALGSESFIDLNRHAELALARLCCKNSGRHGYSDRNNRPKDAP